MCLCSFVCYVVSSFSLCFFCQDKDRSRSRSKDRGSRKHKRRHRSRDRDKDHDRKRRSKSNDRAEEVTDVDREKEKGKRDDDRKSSRRDRDKDRDRDRDRRRSSRSRDRDRDRDRHRDHSRDRDRDRDRDRHRDRRDRDRDRDRDRRRSGSSSRERRRREERERDRSEERRADRRRERQAERERKEKADEDSGRITLRDVITSNPGISVPDALSRMHAINTAMASGTGVVPPLIVPTGPVTQPGYPPAVVNPMVGMAPQQQGAMGAAMAQQQFAATKSQREIYVGNIPPQITIPQLTEFVNEAMKQLGIAQQSTFGGPVITCWISTDAHYAFIELRTVEEALAALSGLNGVSCAGYQLRVGRPKTPGSGGGGGGMPGPIQPMGGLQPLGLGQVMGGAPMGGIGMGTVGGGMAFGAGAAPIAHPPVPAAVEVSDVLMVANLPDSIGESQVRELLAPFGAIKLFNFIKVPMNGGTGGAAVLEYEDPSVGEGAITGLNGLPVGDKQLSVQRVPANMATLLLKPAVPPPPPPTPAPITASEQEDTDPLLTSLPTTILRMSNMTTLEELRDDEVYEELQEDIADECNEHGTVRSLAIPRPGPESTADAPGPGVGDVFVCFTSAEGAERAKIAVHGRTFNGLRVKAVFFPEELFHAKVYALPEGFEVEGGGGGGGGGATTTDTSAAMDERGEDSMD